MCKGPASTEKRSFFETLSWVASAWEAVAPKAVLSGTEGVRDAKEALEACFAAQGPTPATRAGLPALKAQKEAVGWLKGLGYQCHAPVPP